jgi:hypothetical protein
VSFRESVTTWSAIAIAAMAALELPGHLISANAGTPRSQFFIELRQEIEQDQTILRDLLEQLDLKESSFLALRSPRRSS